MTYIDYGDSYLTTLNALATKQITAYADENSNNQSLVLASSSNVHVQVTDNLLVGTDEDLFLSINKSSNVVYLALPGSNIDINNLQVVGEANRTLLSTDKSEGLFVEPQTTFMDDTYFQGDIKSVGNLIGKTMNMWTNNGIAQNDVSEIGYGFRITSNQQLELVKFTKFSDNNSVLKKIAVFGSYTTANQSNSDTSYLVFDGMNGLSASGDSNIGLITSNLTLQGETVLHGVLRPNTANLTDLGTFTSSFSNLFLNSNSHVYFGSNTIGFNNGVFSIKDSANSNAVISAVVNSSNMSIVSHLIPTQNEAYDLGSSAYRFKDLYLSGNTIDLGGLKLKKDSNNNLEISNAQGLSIVGDLNFTGSLLQNNVSVSTGGGGGGSGIGWASTVSGAISTNSNVGIGTSNPAAALHVVGKTFTTNQVLGHSNDTSNAPAFSWTDDSNTGIYNPAADTVAFVTNGVERLRVLSDGKVGIGLSNPSTELQVNGTINATAFTGTTITTLSNAANWSSNVTSSNVVTANWSSNNLFTKTGGTISGATSINNILTTSSNYVSSISGHTFSNNLMTNGVKQSFSIPFTQPAVNASGSNNIVSLALVTNGGWGNPFTVQLSGNANESITQQKYIFNSTLKMDNLTWYKLPCDKNFIYDVNSFVPRLLARRNGVDVEIALAREAGNQYSGQPNMKAFIETIDNNFGITLSNTSTATYTVDNTGYNAFQYLSPNNSNETIITTGSNTIFTSARFLLSNDITCTGKITTNNQLLGRSGDSLNAPGFSWTDDSNTGIYHPAADTVAFVTNGVERLRILSDGKVGVGVSNPSVDFEIKGSAKITSNLEILGNVYISGTTTAVNSTAVTIDDNILTLNDGASYLSSLQAGIEINRGAGYSNYMFVYDETSKDFKTGAQGALQSVATRDETVGNLTIPYYNSTSKVYTSCNLFTYNNGRLGVGLSNPSNTLHIYNSNAVNIQLESPTAKTTIWANDDGKSYFQTSNDLFFGQIGTITNPRMYLTSAGNLGVGVMTPTKGKLEVSGNISVLKSGEARYHLYNNGLVTEWMFGQKSGSSHNFTVSRVASAVENDCFSIASNGNVGVGTTTPGYLFDVAGEARVQSNLYIGMDSTDSNSLYTTGKITFGGPFGDTGYNHAQIACRRYLATGENSELIIAKYNDIDGLSGPDRIRLRAGALAFDTYDSAITTLSNNDTDLRSSNIRMYIKGDGNVGIGTTTPSEVLHVVGKTFTTNQMLGYSNDSSSIPSFSWTDDSNTGMFHPAVDSLGLSTNGVERLRVVSTGNVGIGTTTPSEVLHVVGKTFTTNQVLGYSNDNVNAPGFSWTDDSNTGMFHPAVDSLGLVTNGVERFRVVSTGNVGIGTTAPSARLEVAGDVKVTSTGIQIASDNTYFVIDDNVTSRFGLIKKSGLSGAYACTSNDNLIFGALNSTTLKDVGVSNFTEHMRIGGTSGNVGIGTNSPTYKLHVNGTIYSSSDVIAYSDARIKTDLENIQDSLYKITQINGYTFTRIDTGARQAGVVAQELEQVLPEAVYTDNDGYKSVAYGNISALLIEAIKELNAKLDNVIEKNNLIV
jgi:hypothetical protein